MKRISWASVWAPANRKRLIVAAALLLALVGGAFCWHVFSDPSPSWVVRWRIDRYLKKHGGGGSFKVEFPFPSRAEMSRGAESKPAEPAPPLRGSRTGKDFDALAAEYLKGKIEVLSQDRSLSEIEAQFRAEKLRLEEEEKRLAAAQAEAGATNVTPLQSNVNGLRKRVAALEKRTAARAEVQARETALEPITRDLWEIQRAWTAEAEAAARVQGGDLSAAVRRLLTEGSRKIYDATSYAAIYRAIGQELWVAQRLLRSAHPDHRRAGLEIALQARRHAMDEAVNSWLAARICEGYFWPNLDLADTANRRSPLFLDNLVNECARTFRENDELANVARNYEILLAQATTPQRADWIRVQIAMAHEQAGDFQAALDWLQQIRSTNDFRGPLSRIPQLEKRLGLH